MQKEKAFCESKVTQLILQDAGGAAIQKKKSVLCAKKLKKEDLKLLR